MKFKTLYANKNIQQLQEELGRGMWPEFMQHDKIVEKYWSDLYNAFLHLQFALFDQETLVGLGNSICLNWEGPLSDLPDTGLDWAMEKANRDYREGLKPNLQVGVQILINPEYQGGGISYKMLSIMKDIARNNGIQRIALPVRPTLKSEYPLIDIDEYIRWKNKDGLPLDPWIRVHVNDGGEIINSCKESMKIEGSISEWENWTGISFPKSGSFTVEKALAPIRIDKDANKGTYIEPNVWIIHKID